MGGGKVTKWGENLSFFGSTKMWIFYREKAFHAGKKKSGKMTLYPLKNNPLMPLAVPDLSYR